MKLGVKEQVLWYMQNNTTEGLNTNEFILWYSRYTKRTVDELLKFWESLESVLRSRRTIIKAYWIWSRVNADTEIEYIKEFSLNNKI